MKAIALAVVLLTVTGWHEVLSVSGKGTKQTETFKITTKEWKISWTVKDLDACPKCGVFQCYVYNDKNVLVSVAANVQGPDSDSTIIRGAGTYYLSIIASAPWTVRVDEPTN